MSQMGYLWKKCLSYPSKDFLTQSRYTNLRYETYFGADQELGQNRDFFLPFLRNICHQLDSFILCAIWGICCYWGCHKLLFYSVETQVLLYLLRVFKVKNY